MRTQQFPFVILSSLLLFGAVSCEEKMIFRFPTIRVMSMTLLSASVRSTVTDGLMETSTRKKELLNSSSTPLLLSTMSFAMSS